MAVHGMSHEERRSHLLKSTMRSSTKDWTNDSSKNYVSPVKDQGLCTGAGYAFAATALLESNFSQAW